MEKIATWDLSNWLYDSNEWILWNRPEYLHWKDLVEASFWPPDAKPVTGKDPDAGKGRWKKVKWGIDTQHHWLSKLQRQWRQESLRGGQSTGSGRVRCDCGLNSKVCSQTALWGLCPHPSVWLWGWVGGGARLSLESRVSRLSVLQGRLGWGGGDAGFCRRVLSCLLQGAAALLLRCCLDTCLSLAWTEIPSMRWLRWNSLELGSDESLSL